MYFQYRRRRLPTILRQFPQVDRSGTQQTAWRDLPNQFDFLQLTSQASDATHSDPANAIRFEILHASDVNGTDEKIIQVEEWTGGTYIPKGGSVAVPRTVNTTFGPVPGTGFVAMRAIFNQTINIGATLTGLP